MIQINFTHWSSFLVFGQSMPPIPRRRWVLGVPQSQTSNFRVEFGVLIVGALLRRLLRVFLAIPGHAGTQLLQANIPATNRNDAQRLASPVVCHALRNSLLIESQGRQAGPGLLPEVLRQFGSVDSCQMNLMLPVCRIDERQSVAIGNAEHSAGKGFGMCRDGKQGKKGGESTHR